jgi:predicted RNA binding protein YcfA (HicA-like mRNA interferase family)
MPKLYSSRHILKVLSKHGFLEISQTDSHKKLYDGLHTVIVPAPRRKVPYGTFLSILRQSGLSKSDFE